MEISTCASGGKENYHVKPVVMHMRLPDGTIATTDAGNISVLAPHFECVYTADRPITWEALDNTNPRDTAEGITT